VHASSTSSVQRLSRDVLPHRPICLVMAALCLPTDAQLLREYTHAHSIPDPRLVLFSTPYPGPATHSSISGPHNIIHESKSTTSTYPSYPSSHSSKSLQSPHTTHRRS
jgi:hypothetical protein